MRPLYIFDLDGTLADISHRKHFLLNKEDPDRWRKFYAACDQDLPNLPVIETLNRLYSTLSDIWIFSGRSDEVREPTHEWLRKHTTLNHRLLCPPEYGGIVHMREYGDHTPDDQLKERWLKSMLTDDRKRLVGVFDDRNRIVQMFRRNGVTVFQVADGDF